MLNLSTKSLRTFISKKIGTFHDARLKRLEDIQLNEVLKKKNPYLFRAKNMQNTRELLSSILDAFASSSEEELFGAFLEELAIFVSEKTCGGRKSSTRGIDLEFDRDGVRYLVAIKSGPNWGNSSQYDALRVNFRNGVKVLQQSRSANHPQPVLGICYGKSKTTHDGGYWKIMGQNFWFFLSGDEDLYIDLIEPLGFDTFSHCERYREEREKLMNRLERDFLLDFSMLDGRVNWLKLLQFNSGNTIAHDWR